MKVIGLCGGSGSGKGAVSSAFESFGVPSIDTDAVYRELTAGDSECTRALSREFGKEIISADGSLNRGKLRKIVFDSENSESKLKRLNDISHKYILSEARKRLADFKVLGCKAAIVDAPLLFESRFDKECDFIISVVADREVRIARIMARDGIDRRSAEMRIASQLSDTEIISLSDFVIENNSNLEALNRRVAEVAKIILDN